MIERAWFVEFRALRDVSVALTSLTVLVGPNGSGKTSVLEGIYDVLQVASQPVGAVLRGPRRADRLRNTRATGPMRVGLAFAGGGSRSLQLEVVPYGAEEVHTDEEAPYLATMRATDGDTAAEWPAKVQTLRAAGPAFEALRQEVVRAEFLRLSPRALAAPHYADEEEPRIAPDGEGLASVLADLWSSDFARRDAIVEGLRRVVPSVLRVRVERARVVRQETEVLTVNGERIPRHREATYSGHRVVLDTSSGESIPLVAASEGTVLALGLMAVLYGRHRPRTLLMDDLDRALHPQAQQDLVALLRSVMADDPRLQVIATSHSPSLLDALEHEEVRLCTLDPEGSVRCGALRDHPDFAQWRHQVKPGELWTAGLESWLLAQPKPTP